ncbi:outer membrane transport energization protein ExbD [Jezberella montanilacus]|jgi:biopolymer transport protein ExbD|uniref:Outer membrane transport energization protein ExbD n=1 Tax=Jezberella montanilacus TaxID=323426 RepID=A0A2T0XF38_9BURK|nr:biopolymer transporter ExbD [Jezberella montanilacus]PRY97546.1 outer membrane transport energization protein ExbD [Jezberella montanilacus]
MRYLETKKARIEIIPMIDIMLFLLVFFVMITLKMIPTSGHVTKLPTSSTAETLPNPKVTVELEADGNMIVNGASISPSQLTALLKAGDAEKTAVTIVGAESVSLQNVMHVIDAIKLSGASQLSLAAKNQSDSK